MLLKLQIISQSQPFDMLTLTGYPEDQELMSQKAMTFQPTDSDINNTPQNKTQEPSPADTAKGIETLGPLDHESNGLAVNSSGVDEEDSVRKKPFGSDGILVEKVTGHHMECNTELPPHPVSLPDSPIGKDTVDSLDYRDGMTGNSTQDMLQDSLMEETNDLSKSTLEEQTSPVSELSQNVSEQPNPEETEEDMEEMEKSIQKLEASETMRSLAEGERRILFDKKARYLLFFKKTFINF